MRLAHIVAFRHAQTLQIYVLVNINSNMHNKNNKFLNNLARAVTMLVQIVSDIVLNRALNEF